MTTSTEMWSSAMYVAIGLGVLLAGLGIFVLCLRAGGLLTRLGRTLDEVDQQIGVLSAPIATTLTHVGGIADTADTTIARLGAVVGKLEDVAAAATRAATLIGATLSNFLRKPRPSSDDVT